MWTLLGSSIELFAQEIVRMFAQEDLQAKGQRGRQEAQNDSDIPPEAHRLND